MIFGSTGESIPLVKSCVSRVPTSNVGSDAALIVGEIELGVELLVRFANGKVALLLAVSCIDP